MYLMGNQYSWKPLIQTNAYFFPSGIGYSKFTVAIWKQCIVLSSDKLVILKWLWKVTTDVTSNKLWNFLSAIDLVIQR